MHIKKTFASLVSLSSPLLITFLAVETAAEDCMKAYVYAPDEKGQKPQSEWIVRFEGRDTNICSINAPKLGKLEPCTDVNNDGSTVGLAEVTTSGHAAIVTLKREDATKVMKITASRTALATAGETNSNSRVTASHTYLSTEWVITSGGDACALTY